MQFVRFVSTHHVISCYFCKLEYFLGQCILIDDFVLYSLCCCTLYIVGHLDQKFGVQVHFVTDTLVPNGWSWMQPANGEKTEAVFHLACASFSSSNCFGDKMSETCSEDIIGSHFCCFRGCERRLVSLASLLNKVRGRSYSLFCSRAFVEESGLLVEPDQ